MVLWELKECKPYQYTTSVFFNSLFGFNIQYPPGTPEVPFSISESSGITMLGSPTTGAQVGYKRSAFIGSCKHQIWQAIRASSAAPYYLDDFSDGIMFFYSFAIVLCLIILFFFSFFCSNFTCSKTTSQMYTAGKTVQ